MFNLFVTGMLSAPAEWQENDLDAVIDDVAELEQFGLVKAVFRPDGELGFAFVVPLTPEERAELLRLNALDTQSDD